MKRLLGCLATLALALSATGASAEPALDLASVGPDPIGDLISSALTGALPNSADFHLKATLYHAGGRGIRALDSLGCKVVAMRTAAVDGIDLPRHTVLFIKETVGLTMPDGSKHDGYWYASDVGADAAQPGDADGHESRRLPRLPPELENLSQWEREGPATRSAVGR